MLKRLLIIWILAAFATTQAEPSGYRFLANGYAKGVVSIIAEDGSIERQIHDLEHVQDSWLLPNGNILASWHYGVKEINPTGDVVWEYKSPEGTELYSAQPINGGLVLACEGGPKRLIEINRSGKIVKEIPLVTDAPTHDQFRTARKTEQGTYWVAFKKDEKIEEIASDGSVLRSLRTPKGAHGVCPLPNGNILTSTAYGHEVLEFDLDGKTVWHLSVEDMLKAGIEKPSYTAGLLRLPNGNTIVSMYHGIPQFFEITPEKEVVWTYHNPELGNVSGITLLPPAPTQTALIFSGGYKPHKPHETATQMKGWLEEEGFTVTTTDSMSCLDDAASLARYDLIIPNWTMGKMTDMQIRNLSGAVQEGSGLAGLHGGAGDAFRGVKEYEFMVGGHFKKHPHVGAYTVDTVASSHPIMNGLSASFDYNSEHYFMTMNTDVTVLMDSDYSSEEPNLRMPISWVKDWGKGRVFYTSLGHDVSSEYIQFPEAKKLFINGCLWAARTP